MKPLVPGPASHIAGTGGLAALPGERQVTAAVTDHHPLRRLIEIEIDLQAMIGFAAPDRQVALHLPPLAAA